MGKLIKNHWARLIVLTAAICTSPLSLRFKFTKLTEYRPSSSSNRRLFLAQDILGLPHQEPRWSSKADSRPANSEPNLWPCHVGMGMATWFPCWHGYPPQYRGTTCGPAYDCSFGGAHLPGDQPGNLLYDWNGCLFLGLQRRRGTFYMK